MPNKTQPHALLWTFFIHYKWQILAGLVPRLAYTGFNFAQPFLIQRVLEFMEEPEDVNSRHIAYGLIGAYAIVYIGIAVCGLISTGKGQLPPDSLYVLDIRCHL